MSKHFEVWGWYNFLGSIAESKVFDIPGSGLDSIECAKRTNLYKVLMYSSEKRDYSVAYNNSLKNK
jgi:hypothetical protein